jgi:hypothetical protein
MNIHFGVMKSFNFFSMSEDKHFVVRVVPILKPLYMNEGEKLWKENQNADASTLFMNFFINN